MDCKPMDCKLKSITIRAGLTLPAGESFTSKRIDVEVGIEVDVPVDLSDSSGADKISSYVDPLSAIVKRKVNEIIRKGGSSD